MSDPLPTPERPAGLRGQGELPDGSRATLSSIGLALVTEDPIPGLEPEPEEGRAGLSLGEVLGQGGMSVVRSGVQRALARPVAVKAAREDLGRDDLGRVLLLEARVTGMLEHPNIIPVHDVVAGPDGRPRIVMRKVTGATWTALLADRDRARRLAGDTDLLEWHVRVLMQVCNAVHFAHSLGVVHRDLKPDNVMIGAYGEVYVVDWGLAVTTRADGPRGVPRGDRQPRVAGTPAFMAPEMLGGATITERTDVFLLGATLYTIVSGRPPYWGTVDDALFARVREGRPPLPDRVPPGLARVVRTAMDPDPELRYGSAEELRQALERYLAHRGADGLVAQARVQLGRVVERAAEPGDVRIELYALYGQCRFGFDQALRIEPGRADAVEGREAAVVAMARFELDRGDPEAAHLLLADLSPPPRELVERVEALRRAREAEQSDVERMRRDRDPSVGRVPRLVVITALCLAWTFPPLLAPFVDRWVTGGTSYPQLLLVDVGFVVAIAGSALLLRRQLLTTSFNRWILGGLLLVIGSQLGLDSGAWLAGIPPDLGHAFHLFLWFVAAAFVAMVLERRLAVAAAAYLVGFWVAVAWPSAVYPVISVTNAVLLVVVLTTWGTGRRSAS